MINWPTAVIEAAARRRCVLVIGAGVSAGAKSDSGRSPKTWRRFLADAAETLHPCPKYIKDAIRENRLLDACQYIKEIQGETWLSTIRDEFQAPHYKPSQLHAELYKLDIRTTITLNFDTIYESYVNSLSENTFIVKNYYDDDIRQSVAGTDRYLLKMHGSIETPTRMIFTGKDYAKARTKNRSFYELVNSLLHTHVCLLIGCGLNDPDIQLLFEDYRHVLETTPHYQVVPGAVAEPVKRVIRDNRGINLLEYNKRDNHAELAVAVSNLAESVSLARDELAISREW